MISPHSLSKRLVVILLFAALTMLAGCITSQNVLFSAATAPARAGRYEVQYHVDGKWTKFAAGSLALANRTYSWVEDREPLSLLTFRPDGLRFSLVDIGNNYFIVVVAAGDLRNPTWIGNHMYGIARRDGRHVPVRFSELPRPARVARLYGRSNRENQNPRVPLFEQDVSHWCVDGICKTYGHVETTGTIRSLEPASGEVRGMPRNGTLPASAGERQHDVRTRRNRSGAAHLAFGRRRAARAHSRRMPGIGQSGGASLVADPRRSDTRHRLPQSHEQPGSGGHALPPGDAPPLVVFGHQGVSVGPTSFGR